MVRALTVVLIWLAFLVPASAAILKEDDLLLLDVMLDRQRLASSITAYSYRNSVAVSLAELAGALEFPIDVNAAAGTASGSIIRAERRFELNLPAGYVEIDGKRSSLSADDAIAYKDGIFVSMEALSRWFPADFALNMQSLSIEVKPRESLPSQLRASRRASASQISTIGPASLPPIDNSYRLLGPQALDLGLGYSIHRNRDSGKATTGLTYSGLLAGDVAYMDSRVYFGGDKNDALTNFRASLSRDKLNGPLGLRYVEVGDVVPALVTGGSTGAVERGILIQGGGSAIGRDDLINGDVIRIAGDALEGWDVELFQNGMRIGYQTVGPNGRYSFENIEPISGDNSFELVFYGPNGEERRETVNRYSGLGPDLPGSVRYQLAVSQKGEQLYDPTDTAESVTAPISNRGSTRFSGGLEVRVLPQLSLRSGWSSVMVDDQRLNYYTVGARAGLWGATAGIDAIRDPNGGTRWDASLQVPAGMRFWGFDTRFIHTQYANFVPEVETTPEELKLRSRTGVTLTGPIGPVTSRFSAFYNREPDRNYTTLTAGFTSKYENFHYGNNLSYQSFGADSTGYREPNRVSGNLFFSSRSGPLAIRGGANYTLDPDTRFDRYYIDSNVRVAQDMTMNFGLTYDPLLDLTRYTAGFNWRLPQVIISPRLTYDSNGDYSGFVYTTFSMGPRPDRTALQFSSRSLATNGTILARVFLDKDGSGTFSAGDEPLPNVKVRAPQAVRTAATDSEGVARLNSLSAERPTDVVIDLDTLPNPKMLPVNAGNSVQARATTTALVDFPVMLTGSVDGRVYVRRGSNRLPLPGTMIEMHDASGKQVAFKVSAHDGYFVFEGVPYGAYTLAIGGTRSKQAAARRIVIGEARPDVRKIDFELSEAVEQAAAGIRVAQPSPAVESPRVLSPLATPARAEPAPQAAPRAPSDVSDIPAAGTDGRLVQVGVFSAVENAVAELQRLIANGVVPAGQAHILQSRAGGLGVVHRIVLSPGRSSAEAMCRSIKSRGGSCIGIDPKVL